MRAMLALPRHGDAGDGAIDDGSGATDATPASNDASPETAVDASGASDAGDAKAFPVTAVVWPTNGHAYEVVATVSSMTWDAARLEATVRGGHLVSITSAAENDFVFTLAVKVDAAWMLIGSVAGNPIYGPWIGGVQAPGSVEPAGRWSWVTGEPFGYTNWRQDEPSNGAEAESVVHLYAGSVKGATWNELPLADRLKGYVVEYE